MVKTRFTTRTRTMTRTRTRKNKREKSIVTSPHGTKRTEMTPIVRAAGRIFKQLIGLLGSDWIAFYFRVGQSTKKFIDHLTKEIIRLSPYDYTIPAGFLAEGLTPKQMSFQRLAFTVYKDRSVNYNAEWRMFSTDIENIRRVFMGAYDIYVVYETVNSFDFIDQAPIPQETRPVENLTVDGVLEIPLIDPMKDLVPEWWIRQLFSNVRWKAQI